MKKETHVILGYGKLNPPSITHHLLATKLREHATKLGGEPQLYISNKEGGRKNPLPYAYKLDLAKKAFGDDIVKETNQSNPYGLIKSLSGKYDHITLITGDDRVAHYHKMVEQGNGKDFKFKTTHVLGLGHNDSENETGMTSATAMREHARYNNHTAFTAALPPTIRSESHNIIQHIRKAMNLKEVTKEDMDIVATFTSLLEGIQAEEIELQDMQALEKKALAAAIPVTLLREVFLRGVKDWDGNKTGLSKTQYAFNRVNSYVNQGKAYWQDKDLNEAWVRPGVKNSSKLHKLARHYGYQHSHVKRADGGATAYYKHPDGSHFLQIHGGPHSDQHKGFLHRTKGSNHETKGMTPGKLEKHLQIIHGNKGPVSEEVIQEIFGLGKKKDGICPSCKGYGSTTYSKESHIMPRIVPYGHRHKKTPDGIIHFIPKIQHQGGTWENKCQNCNGTGFKEDLVSELNYDQAPDTSAQAATGAADTPPKSVNDKRVAKGRTIKGNKIVVMNPPDAKGTTGAV